MTPLGDHQSADDTARLIYARARARRRVLEIADVRRESLRSAFREELGATVRSASPLLPALLEPEGLALDEAVKLLVPAQGWPRRPRLSRLVDGECGAGAHSLRHHFAGSTSGGLASRPRDPGHRRDIWRPDGGYLRLEVVGHSLEASARIGPVILETRCGVLRIELSRGFPDTLLAASVGRTVESVVDHPALRGRGWRIADVGAVGLAFSGPVLVVPTGASPYRMPWAR